MDAIDEKWPMNVDGGNDVQPGAVATSIPTTKQVLHSLLLHNKNHLMASPFSTVFFFEFRFFHKDFVTCSSRRNLSDFDAYTLATLARGHATNIIKQRNLHRVNIKSGRIVLQQRRTPVECQCTWELRFVFYRSNRMQNESEIRSPAGARAVIGYFAKVAKIVIKNIRAAAAQNPLETNEKKEMEREKVVQL